MEKSPLEKRILLRTGTGRYNHVYEGGRKTINRKMIEVEGMSEERSLGPLCQSTRKKCRKRS
jgi:hypothetical protein